MLRIPALLLLLILTRPGGAVAQDLADEVFYHFMPIAWRDSDLDPNRFGDFGGMTASLDYLADSLGVTAIWMNPIHPSPAYHGYQHGRGDELNAWFGTEPQFTAFLTAAHAKGIKVYLDFVAYGISHDSPWFQDAFGNPASSYDDWLAFENGSNTSYLGSTFPTWNGATVGFIHWDLRDPGPVSLVTQWAQKWLDPDMDGNFTDGVDGYRLDHVWQTYPNGPDGWGYHIDTFWAPWRDSLRAVNPDVIIFGEQADWGIHGQQLFEGMDATFTKPFEFAARYALATGDAGALIGEMANTLGALESTALVGTFMATISDHDVDRLGSAIGSGFDRGKAAAAVLLTQPFPPVIYYGDEIGMLGTKNTGYSGDAADIPMREPFKWNAVAGPPMSNYFILNGPAYTGRISQDNDGRSVEEQLGVPGSLLEAYRELIALRKANVALRHGDYAHVPSGDGSVWAFVREDAGQQVLVVINVSGSAVGNILDFTDFMIPGGTTTPTSLLDGGTKPALTDAGKASYALPLGGYAYDVLELDITHQPAFSPIDGADIPADFSGLVAATQNNGTGLGDNQVEMNRLFVRTEGTDLHVGITGNLVTNAVGLCLLVDSEAGGQNVLDFTDAPTPPNGPDQLTGLALDPGFSPDHMLFANLFNGTLYVDRYELLDGGGVDKTYVGQGTANDGNGDLTGGNNPNGIQVAIDNSNTDGITETTVERAPIPTTGIEMVLPFADLGIPTGPGQVKLAAFFLEPDGNVSNQWLPGVGGGFGNLGTAPDMTLLPGAQCVLLGLPRESTGAVDPPGPGGLSLAVTNPVRGSAAIRFDLPAASPVGVAVLDVQGRVVQRVLDRILPAGPHETIWDGRTETGRLAPAGVYFVRLISETGSRSTRLVVLK